ncbi:MAG: DUF5050 domain-containing protein [Hungatella sp.]|nr:DUF5050 domain-containing protein [Hungatella sp.]
MKALVLFLALLLIALVVQHDHKISESNEEKKELFINEIFNYSQGNYLTVSDGSIYYRSQTDNYYLYTSDMNGDNRRLLVSQIPGAIYPVDTWVYFVNISDDKKLYRVNKNGALSQQVTDHSVEDLVLLGDTFYYRSKDKTGEEYGTEGDYFYSYDVKEQIPRLISKEVYIDTISHSTEEREGLKLEGNYVLTSDGETFLKEMEGERGEVWYRMDERRGKLLIENPQRFPYIVTSSLRVSDTDGSDRIPYMTSESTRNLYIEKDQIFDNESVYIQFPVFKDTVPGYEEINKSLDLRMECLVREHGTGNGDLLKEDEEYEFTSFYVYADDEYVSILYMEDFGEHHEYGTFLFSAITGEELCPKDIFTVPEREYLKAVYFAVGKELESQGCFGVPFCMEIPDFKHFVLTDKGIVVLCREDAISLNGMGTAYFEIRYGYFDGMLRKYVQEIKVRRGVAWIREGIEGYIDDMAWVWNQWISGKKDQDGDMSGFDDGKPFVNEMSNYSGGDYLTSSDGSIYYRSQTDHYYLYASDADGKNQRLLASEIPGSIYPAGDWVYFVNISDRKKLYRVKKEGELLEQVMDQPVHDLILIGDTFYYHSEYREEYDTDHMAEDKDERKRDYFYSYKIGDQRPRLRYKRRDTSFGSDGEMFYSITMEPMDVFYKVRDLLKGHLKYVKPDYGECIWPKVYLDSLFYKTYRDDQSSCYLKRKSLDSQERDTTVWMSESLEDYQFYDGCVYIKDRDSIKRVDLWTLESETVASDLELGERFVLTPDGNIFIKGFEEGCGDVWYRTDRNKQKIPLEEPKEFPYVIASSLRTSKTDRPFDEVGHIEGLDRIPYVTSDRTKRLYIESDYIYEREDVYIQFPVFKDTIPGYQEINKAFELKAEEMVNGNTTVKGKPLPKDYTLQSFYVYVDDEYVCVSYREQFRYYHDHGTFLFSSVTGEELCLDDIFCVPRREYLKAFYYAIGKELELQGTFGLPFYVKEPWEDDLIERFYIYNFALTDKGIVVFYYEGSIACNAAGIPFFEIRYDYFDGILQQSR